MDEMITITKREYDALKRAELKLDCLEEAGVDNWCGYSEAMKLFRSNGDENE